ncbi:MAG: DUF4143 domain-containing protein [Bacteroidia bacterium]|nr:DUF4143 domain-containing protein [Bacteroidia bacterium]
MINALGIQSQMIGLNDLSDFYRGRIIQHMVFQQVLAQTTSLESNLHFWVREKANSNSEIDLVYPYDKYLIPVEVKSGSQGRLRSLHQFIKRTNHSFAIRMLGNTLSIEELKTPEGFPYILLNLPYYLASNVHDYCKWFVEIRKH